MGYDYAFVHLFYTIPPAVALTCLYHPFLTRLEIYKISFLIIIAISATIPWDSYLIHNQIWTYPSTAIMGPTLFRIPAEEVFFFFIQTYTTSLLYIILSKPTFHPVYLRGPRDGAQFRYWRFLGQMVLASWILCGAWLVRYQQEGLYLGLIIVWAGPFILLLWSLAYQFILDLHWTNTILPIVLPTTYLWIVDTLALQRGTWAIESGTKLNWYLWRGLDLEEAVFFLVTNVLIVFGLTAFDNALAVLNTFPDRFESRTGLPSPLTLVKSLLLPLAQYDQQKIDGLREALARLKKKSRSFYLASGVFEGQLRVDLILLYSFCRVADDLVDNARTTDEARSWIEKLKSFLTMRYRDPSIASDALSTWLTKQGFSTSTRAALMMLPTTKLSPQPLHDLLQGFRTDLKFGSRNTPFPILDGDRLELYAMQVAGTVAELCIELVFHHTREKPTKEERRSIIQAGGQMGIALQCVNIARDIIVDAHLQRVYLPTTWLKDLGLRPEDILKSPESPSVEILRNRLLDKATELHDQAAGAIDRLPSEACGPIRVAVECYMEIGKTLRTRGYKVKAGRATVPKIQSLRVAWIAMRA